MKQDNDKSLLFASLILIAGVVIICLFAYSSFSSSYDNNDSDFPNSNNTSDFPGKINFIELRSGSNNEINNKSEIIIKNAELFSDTWTKMFPTEMIASAVDFEKSMIVIITQGQKSSGGHSIGVEKIQESSSIKVYITETSPGEGCLVTHAFTSPFQIIEMQKSNKSVEFVYTQKTTEC